MEQVRRVLPFLTFLIVAAALYDGWVFYSRWDNARQAQHRRDEKEAEEARRTLELIGHLKIDGFYAVPGVIGRGQPARLCYSVLDAKTVRIEPAVKELYPALSYCFEVSPRKSTEYKLFAEDGAGHSVTATTTLTVVP